MSEKPMTATDVMMMQHRFDLRRLRSEALVAAALNELGDLVSDREEAYYRLRKLFFQEGVEVLTDNIRQEIGLAPRLLDGWTDAEIRALEASRLETLLRPITIPLVAKL